MDDWSGGSRCFSAPGTRASYCFRWIPYARDAQRCEFAVGLRDKHWSGWLWALAGRSPPERKPVQPATARPHTPRYRQNPRNLALGWCLIRSFWLNQLTLCWRGLDSNFQYVRELAPSLRGRPRPQSLPQLARAEDRSCDAADRLGVYRQRQRCPRMDFLQLVHQRWMPCLRHTSTVFAPA
jgi:hypothetical protein